MFKQPAWVKKHKEEVKDQITILPGQRTIAPRPYSTGAGSDGVVQPRNPAMLDLTEFHEGEEVIPHKTVKMAGGHEKVRSVVEDLVQQNGGTVDDENSAAITGYGCGGRVKGYYNGGTVKLDKKPNTHSSGEISEAKAPTVSEAPGPIAPDYKPNIISSGTPGSTTPTVKLDAKPQTDFSGNIPGMGTQEAPTSTIKQPDFKPVEMDSKITVDPKIEVDPKYKGAIDTSLEQTQDIARGESEVQKTIINRAMQNFDAKSQTEMNKLKMRISNNPNMTDAQKRSAMASAIRNMSSQRAGLSGQLAEQSMDRAEKAIGDVADIAGRQQDFERIKQQFEIERETANQIYEKNFDYNQTYNNNVQSYLASKDRRDFEYKAAYDEAQSFIQAGDYEGANAAYDKLGFKVDMSKAVEAQTRQIQAEEMDLRKGEQDIQAGELDLEGMKRQAESDIQKSIGNAFASIGNDIANGWDFEHKTVQEDLKRAYELQFGEGTATGPEYEKWANETFTAMKIKSHPVWGPVDDFGEDFIEDMLTAEFKTDENPDWTIDDYEFAGKTGIEAGKMNLADIIMGKAIDIETGEWDAEYDWALGSGGKKTGVNPEDPETPTDPAPYKKTGDVFEDAPGELNSILEPMRKHKAELVESHGESGTSNLLQEQAEGVRKHIAGMTKAELGTILSDPNMVNELKTLGVIEEYDETAIGGRKDLGEFGLNWNFKKATHDVYKGDDKEIKNLTDGNAPTIVVKADGTPYILEEYKEYDKSVKGNVFKGSVKYEITAKNLLTNKIETLKKEKY